MRRQKRNRHISRVLYFACFFFFLGAFLWNCQHARIRVFPSLPEECKPWNEKKSDPSCVEKKEAKKKELEAIPVTVKEYEHVYYFWGLRPDDIPVNLQEECPNGVYEIHQFSTFKNGLYEQLTLGFYSPRTLRLTCYTKDPEPSSAPSRGKRR